MFATPAQGTLFGARTQQGFTSGVSSSINKPASASDYTGIITSLGKVASGFVSARAIKDTMKFNARLVDLQKRANRIGVEEDLRRIREAGNSMLSTQRAIFANRGLALSGSALNVMQKSIEESELDAIFTEINADLGISAIDTKARINEMESRAEMINTMVEPILGAF